MTDTNTISGVFILVPSFNSTRLLTQNNETVINFENIPAVATAISTVAEYNVHHFNIKYQPTADITRIPIDNWAELQLITQSQSTDGGTGSSFSVGQSFNLKYTSPPFSLFTRITHRSFSKATVTDSSLPKFPQLTFRIRSAGSETASVGRIVIEYILRVRSVIGDGGAIIPLPGE